MTGDCGKTYGARRLVCVRRAGHRGQHSHIRSAQRIGVLLRKKPPARGDS